MQHLIIGEHEEKCRIHSIELKLLGGWMKKRRADPNTGTLHVAYPLLGYAVLHTWSITASYFKQC